MATSRVKSRLSAYFIANVGRVVTARELQEIAAPASEWARRVRELRDEQGWPISTQNDDGSLKQGNTGLKDCLILTSSELSVGRYRNALEPRY